MLQADRAVHITAAGKAALEEELMHLKSGRRPQIVEWVQAAREGTSGDIADAAELGEAQREQALVDARIADLERVLADAEVVTVANDGAIGLGSSVTVRDEDGIDAYTIVGPVEVEAGLRSGRVSSDAPVGRALLGRRAGDVIEVETPLGRRRLEILKVE